MIHNIKKTGSVSHEKFIRIWNGAGSVDEVVKATGLTRPTIFNRKKVLVGLGVELKLFPGMTLNTTETERLISLSKETLATV